MANYITPSNHIAFTMWAKKMIPILNLINISVPKSDDLWREWVLNLKILNPNLNIPNPTDELYPGKEGWIKWGNLFILNLNL